MEKLLCPSLLNLSDDCLRDEVRALDRSGADILHLDVMDGDYVPNFGMSFNEIAAVRANTGLPLDLHMTMRNPRRYVRRYAACGVDIIYIHPDSEAVPTETRALIRDLGKQKCVIFSSHILSEVQTVCDEILMIAGGRLVAFDTPENLETQLRAAQQVSLTARAGEERLQEVLSTVEGTFPATFVAGEDGYTTVTVNTSGGYGLTERLFRAFAAADLPLAELRVNKADLEDVFLKLAESEETENPENKEEEA